jgi:hypothetical protein
VLDPARSERTRNPDLPLNQWRRSVTGRLLPFVPEFGPSLLALEGTAQFLASVVDPGVSFNRTPQREVMAWSRRSRARMTRRLAELDYGPLIRMGTPAMVTLTYPGEWLSVAPNGRAVKRHLRLLQRRWATRWGSPLLGPWTLEFQGRGAPHVHIWTVPPLEPALSRGGFLLPARGFCEWLSSTWAEIVDHQDVIHRMRHESAGTAVDYAEGTRYADPRRLAAYFSGHSAKHADGKEYQHVVPESWRAPGQGPGRWWGFWGLRVERASVAVDLEAFLAVRRTLRRLSRSRGRVSAVTVRRERVDRTTGEIRTRRRTCRRRIVNVTSTSLVGGWLMTNDGPGLARGLSRLPGLRT